MTYVHHNFKEQADLKNNFCYRYTCLNDKEYSTRCEKKIQKPFFK